MSEQHSKQAIRPHPAAHPHQPLMRKYPPRGWNKSPIDLSLTQVFRVYILYIEFCHAKRFYYFFFFSNKLEPIFFFFLKEKEETNSQGHSKISGQRRHERKSEKMTPNIFWVRPTRPSFLLISIFSCVPRTYLRKILSVLFTFCASSCDAQLFVAMFNAKKVKSLINFELYMPVCKGNV